MQSRSRFTTQSCSSILTLRRSPAAVLSPTFRLRASPILIQRQQEMVPFGGFNTLAYGDMARIFASPGPIYEPEARRPDYRRAGRALFAAGFRKGDVIHNQGSMRG